jgi:DNA-binding NarL/FixJ family response regulator
VHRHRGAAAVPRSLSAHPGSRGLDAGARGYITKTSALMGLPPAMQAVMEGGRYVPPQAQSPDLH